MSLFAQAFTMQNDSEDTGAPSEELEVVAQLNEDAAEIIEAEAIVQKEEATQDDMEERVGVAEEMETTLQAAIASGEGLSPATAAAYQQGFKALFGSVIENPIATLQSFGGDSQRLAATQYTAQKLGDAIKKIWNAIKQAVLRGIAAVKDFFAKLFGGADGLKKRVEAIRKKLADAKTDGRVAPTDKVKISGGTRLHVAGKMDPASVKAGLNLASKEVSDCAKGILEAADTYYKDVAGGLKAADEKALAKLLEGKMEKDVSAVKMAMQVKGKPLPGGKALVIQASGDTEKEGSGAAKIFVGDAPKADYNESEEIQVPNANDLEAMLKSVESIITQLEGRKKQSEDLVKQRDDAIKAGDALIKAGEGGKLSNFFDGAKLSASLRLANFSYNRALSSLNGYLFSTARAGLVYIDACASSYKKKA
jgi:hypothetical protein